jgi:hypothetical protein
VVKSFAQNVMQKSIVKSIRKFIVSGAQRISTTLERHMARIQLLRFMLAVIDKDIWQQISHEAEARSMFKRFKISEEKHAMECQQDIKIHIEGR